MKSNKLKLQILAGLVLLVAPAAQLWAGDIRDRIETAIDILDTRQHSDNPIPLHLLHHAKGIAIFTVTKVGLGIGGQGGEGIVLLHLSDGKTRNWTAPAAFNVAGGSIGAQIGIAKIRYIVILNSDDAVRHFTTSDKLDMNATATGTAGAETGSEHLSTDDLEHRELVIYRDSGGIYGGATLGGTTVNQKQEINEEAYGDSVRSRDILNGSVPPPQSAAELYSILNGLQK